MRAQGRACIEIRSHGTFNEIQEGFRQINVAESRVDLQRGTITENAATAKQQIASAKIKLEYANRLKKSIGEREFSKYTKFLHKYNNGLLNDMNNEGHIIIDF